MAQKASLFDFLIAFRDSICCTWKNHANENFHCTVYHLGTSHSRCLHSSHKILLKCIYFSLKTAHISEPARAGKKHIGNWCTDSALSLRYNMINFSIPPVHNYAMHSIDQQWIQSMFIARAMMQNLLARWIKCHTFLTFMLPFFLPSRLIAIHNDFCRWESCTIGAILS